MRKRVVQPSPPQPSAPDEDWLDLATLAEVEITSEAADHPIEGALLPRDGRGWRAAYPGEQTIRLIFNNPLRIRRILLEFRDSQSERTQEFVLRWSGDGGKTFSEVVRQQWNFSRTGSTCETEDYPVDLRDVSAIELTIVPDVAGGDARACLTRLRLG